MHWSERVEEYVQTKVFTRFLFQSQPVIFAWVPMSFCQFSTLCLRGFLEPSDFSHLCKDGRFKFGCFTSYMDPARPRPSRPVVPLVPFQYLSSCFMLWSRAALEGASCDFSVLFAVPHKAVIWKGIQGAEYFIERNGSFRSVWSFVFLRLIGVKKLLYEWAAAIDFPPREIYCDDCELELCRILQEKIQCAHFETVRYPEKDFWNIACGKEIFIFPHVPQNIREELKAILNASAVIARIRFQGFQA